MKLWFEKIPSPIGTMLVISDGEVLRSLDFEDFGPRQQKQLRSHYRDHELREGRVPGDIADALRAYFAGELRAIERLRTATGGTAFQKRVWAALREIPVGMTESYGALGKRLGMPQASRAVGLANGANPVAIVVPCHRVIGADGSLTGYGGGLERKRWLLAHEGVMLRRAA
jgi:methylated-DNA-[protein]-cysteine S-methyltransferase